MPAKKKSSGARRKQTSGKKNVDVDLKGVRQKVVNAIGGRAEELAIAVTDDAVKKAQVQPMKILFDIIGLFHEAPAEGACTGEDQSLAKELLEQLGLADDAVPGDDESGPMRPLDASAVVLMPAPLDPVK